MNNNSLPWSNSLTSSQLGSPSKIKDASGNIVAIVADPQTADHIVEVVNMVGYLSPLDLMNTIAAQEIPINKETSYNNPCISPKTQQQ